MSPPPQAYLLPPAYVQPVILVAPPARPTSGWATASLVFGLLGLLGGFCLFGVPCVAAVICGHVGLVNTKDGTEGGRGMAVTGLILGYLFVVPAIIVIVMGGIGAFLPAT